MNETQIIEKNIYEILVPRPRLNTFCVHIDGKRQKTQEIAQYARYGAKMAGYLTWKTFALGCMALDYAIEHSDTSR